MALYLPLLGNRLVSVTTSVTRYHSTSVTNTFTAVLSRTLL